MKPILSLCRRYCRDFLNWWKACGPDFTWRRRRASPYVEQRAAARKRDWDDCIYSSCPSWSICNKLFSSWVNGESPSLGIIFIFAPKWFTLGLLSEDNRAPLKNQARKCSDSVGSLSREQCAAWAFLTDRLEGLIHCRACLGPRVELIIGKVNEKYCRAFHIVYSLFVCGGLCLRKGKGSLIEDERWCPVFVDENAQYFGKLERIE